MRQFAEHIAGGGEAVHLAQEVVEGVVEVAFDDQGAVHVRFPKRDGGTFH